MALAFSQMFNLLCERADNVHGGRLPHHVRVLWDEAANTGQVPQLEKLVAVIRSREVSLCLFYQQLAQCKAIYDKHAETILGNMDSVVFLGARKYDLNQHPNFKHTAEADKKNAFDLDRLINRNRRPGLNEVCEVHEVSVPDEALVYEDEDILNYDDLDDMDAFV